MRAVRIVILIVVLLILGAVVYGVIVVRHGLSAHAQPSAAEILVARRVRSLAVPVHAKRINNPVLATADNIHAGMAHWADHCALCHANNGNGDTEIGRNLYPNAPDMRLKATQDMTDGELYYTIQNGIRLTGMPAWGSPGYGDHNMDSWKLVLFIRHLPQLKPEEEKEMEELNPKTPEELQEEQEEQQFLNEQPSNPQPKKHHTKSHHH